MGMKAFESDLLSIFLRSEKAYIKFSSRLKPESFKNEALRWVFEVYASYFDKYKSAPNLKVLKEELLKTSLPTDKKKAYYLIIRKLFKKETKISAKYLEDKIKEKVEYESFLKLVDIALIDLEKKGISKARKKLLKNLVLGSEDEEGVTTGILKDWKKRQQIRKELSKIPLRDRFVSTPYSLINSTTYGIQVTESATIAGLTGMGKSIVAGEFGANSLMEGLNVLHFPLENTAEQTAQRYDSRLTEVEYDTIKLYKFKKSELHHFRKVFKSLRSSLENDVVLHEIGRNKVDFVYIDGVVQSLKLKGFNTQLLIVDSCDIINPIGEFKEHRLGRAGVYWDFKDFSKLNRIPGLTTTQLKSTSKWKISTVEDLAEAYDKARILDIVYILSQTEEDSKKKIVRFGVDKNRDGVGGISINLFDNKEKMRFLEVV